MAKVMSAFSRVRFANIGFVKGGLVKYGIWRTVVFQRSRPPNHGATIYSRSQPLHLRDIEAPMTLRTRLSCPPTKRYRYGNMMRKNSAIHRATILTGCLLNESIFRHIAMIPQGSNSVTSY